MKPFCGVPLVGWSIMQGVAATSVDEVWVSTDGDEIAEYAKSLGAHVMIRGYQDTDETSGSVPVQECVDRLFASGHLVDDDLVICRLCTTPHLLPHDVDNFMRTFQKRRLDYGFEGMSAGAETRTHICSRVLVPGLSIGIPEATCHNDYSIAHHLAFIGVNLAKHFRAKKPYPNDGQGPPPKAFSPLNYYSVNEWQMQDVDTPEEWEFAELVAEHYILKGRTPEEVYCGNN